MLGPLPTQERLVLEDGILASAWYPMLLFLHFMQEVERQLTSQEPQVIRRMGQASAEYGIKGVYKVFFKIGSPEFIIGRAARVFGSYYDTGQIVVAESRAGRPWSTSRASRVRPSSASASSAGWRRPWRWRGRSTYAPTTPARPSRRRACRFVGDWD